jgi:hypothetical protein
MERVVDQRWTKRRWMRKKRFCFSIIHPHFHHQCVECRDDVARKRRTKARKQLKKKRRKRRKEGDY